MQEFYNKALMSLVFLVFLSILLGYLCISHTFLKITLLPASESDLFWRAESVTDAIQDGRTSLKMDDDKFSLSYVFNLSHQARYPNAAVAMMFYSHKGRLDQIDLSQYDTISFNAKCTPANTLTFAVATFDDKVSNTDDLLTYRSPSTFFACNENWNRVELDLTRLETPQWWFDMFKVDLSRQEYKLNKVSRLNFSSSFQSPFDVDAKVQLNEITLKGRNWFYLYLFGGVMIVLWGSYGLWFFRQHTHALVGDLRDKLQRDRPLVAYQQLTVEPHRDKDKNALLHFMATEYSNSDLNLEGMAASIGVSRTKINDILKAELGFTFTGYLNKLRLTEAARLLAEKDDANIAEIAYSVGYKNVSYFNKLFKEEYGCTPKAFKSLCDQAPGDAETSAID